MVIVITVLGGSAWWKKIFRDFFELRFKIFRLRTCTTKITNCRKSVKTHEFFFRDFRWIKCNFWSFKWEKMRTLSFPRNENESIFLSSPISTFKLVVHLFLPWQTLLNEQPPRWRWWRVRWAKRLFKAHYLVTVYIGQMKINIIYRVYERQKKNKTVEKIHKKANSFIFR